jgi:hypothetical protein
MNRISLAISCPIDTYSGYGARARDIVKALITLDKYDIQILSQRWGNTSFGYLKDHNEQAILDLIVPKLTQQPDIWIQHTVPNEFQKVGKYNIGVTAGIETNQASPIWVEGVNRMDLVLVSSNHAKEVFERSIYNKSDQNNNPAGQLKLTAPIEVLFEGVDITKYCKTTKTFDLSSIPESFCFLFVGHWLQGTFGEDRKNVGYTIKAFLETFKNKPQQPALLLKVGLGTSSVLNTQRIQEKIEEIRSSVRGKLPNIYLIDGDLTDEEMNSLYNSPKVKVMISFTKGEGFGRPLLEFSTTGKPLLVSGWSGHTDFLDFNLTNMVGGSLQMIHPSAQQKDVLIEGSEWFKPDDIEVGKKLKELYKHYSKYTESSKKQGFRNKTEFNLDKMTMLLGEILDKNIPEFPKQIQLTLPKLDSLPKLKLPNI